MVQKNKPNRTVIMSVFDSTRARSVDRPFNPKMSHCCQDSYKLPILKYKFVDVIRRHGITQYGCHDASGPSNRSRAKDCTKAQRSVECEQRAAAVYTRHHHPHLISPAAFRQAQNGNMLTTALYPN
jgi:hypothetical protein